MVIQMGVIMMFKKKLEARPSLLGHLPQLSAIQLKFRKSLNFSETSADTDYVTTVDVVAVDADADSTAYTDYGADTDHDLIWKIMTKSHIMES